MSIIADDNDFEKQKIEKKNPVVKPEAVDCDKNFENCIRPKSFDTYIGQSALKDTLKITIKAAQKREKPYGEFVEMIYQVQKNVKDPGTYSNKQMLDDLSKFSKQITLWGSSRVINKWIEFRENGSDPEKAKNNLFLMEEIMNDMRKDLGLKKVKKGNLLGFFINDIKNE